MAKARPSKGEVEVIHRAYEAIHRLATILEADATTSAEVEARVRQWTTDLDDSLGKTTREKRWREHFKQIVDAFGPRLFTCYDHPLIPRTNNDMEQAFRALSRHERRVTGRKHVGPRLVRIQGLVGAGARLLQEATPVDRIAALPKPQRTGFQPRRQRLAKPRGQGLAFRRDPEQFLAQLEQT